jgi:DNA polymerase III epsilon subunit-like protein
MSFISIDTETTGLPTSRAKPTTKNISHYDSCRMISIAVVEFNSLGKEVDSWHAIIRPDNFKVDATHIHGITQEHAEKEGRPFMDIYYILAGLLYLCPDVVGHNLQFDLNVIKSEFIRCGLDDGLMDSINPICTLKLYRQIFLKPIKLVALYKGLFNKELEGAHDALNDARAAGEAYTILKEDPRVYKALPHKRITIKASEVAACMGLSNFRKPADVIDDLWKKVSPETFEGQTRDEVNLAALAQSVEAQATLKAALIENPESSDEVQTILKRVQEMVSTDEKLSPRQKSQVNDHMRKMIYTTHGINSEDKTADLDEAELFTDETFYKWTIAVIEGTEYQVVGRIDRYQKKADGTKVLVEIKNRTKALFNKVRDYEFVQVLTYLHMMELGEARLIEQFNNERKSYDINFDPVYWQTEVIPKMENFCKTFHHLLGQA